MACCFKIGQSSEILDIFNGCLKNNVDNTLKTLILLHFLCSQNVSKTDKSLKSLKIFVIHWDKRRNQEKIQENTRTWPKSAQEPILELGACPAKEGMQIA